MSKRLLPIEFCNNCFHARLGFNRENSSSGFSYMWCNLTRETIQGWGDNWPIDAPIPKSCPLTEVEDEPSKSD